jgi:hypothetical protein
MTVAASTILVAGCGDDGKSSDEDYFVELEDLMQEADERSRALQDALNQDFESGSAEIEATRGFYAATAENMSRFVADINAMSPTNAVRTDHDQFVLAGEELAEALSQINGGVAGVESLTEMNSLADSLISESSTRFVDACRDLQLLANTNGIDVDLNCADA